MATWQEKMDEWLLTYLALGHLQLDTKCPPLPPNLSWTGSGGPPVEIEHLYDLTKVMVWHTIFTYQNMHFRIHCNSDRDIYQWEIS
jgi:hypothetical protein